MKVQGITWKYSDSLSYLLPQFTNGIGLLLPGGSIAISILVIIEWVVTSNDVMF